jgi:hypothetical protein
VRIARGQNKFFGAVGFGQFGFRRCKILRRRHGAERVFPARTADGRGRGLVAFEQERRYFNLLAADVSTANGCGFWFGGAARAHNAGGRLFPGWRGVWFCFHNRNSLFLALNSLPVKSYGGNLPDAMGIFRQGVDNFY